MFVGQLAIGRYVRVLEQLVFYVCVSFRIVTKWRPEDSLWAVALFYHLGPGIESLMSGLLASATYCAFSPASPGLCFKPM